MTRAGSCRSCHRPIVWSRTKTDKPIPLDPEEVTEWIVPTEDVKYVKGLTEKNPKIVLVADDGLILHGYRAGPLTEFAIQRTGRISHFATCPQSGSWRKSGGKAT